MECKYSSGSRKRNNELTTSEFYLNKNANEDNIPQDYKLDKTLDPIVDNSPY